MHTLQTLEFVRVSPTAGGLFGRAKFIDWNHEYNFLVQPDGKIRGRTSVGYWQELSQEAAGLIYAKLQAFLRRQRVSLN